MLLVAVGELGKAAEFCAASCQTVEAVHGSHSIELATELLKLAQLLFNRYNIIPYNYIMCTYRKK